MATPKHVKPRRTFIRKKTTSEPEKKVTHVEKPKKEEPIEEKLPIEETPTETTPDTVETTSVSVTEATLTTEDETFTKDTTTITTTTMPADTNDESKEEHIDHREEATTEPLAPEAVEQTTTVDETPAANGQPSTPFFTSSVAVEKPDPKKLLWILGPILAIVLLFVGGYFINSMNKKAPAAKKAVVAVEPTEEPTPTPEEVNRTEYTIKILNGHGTSGAASKASDLLEDEGFNVDDIGNLGKTDYTETIIQTKEDVSEAYLKELESVLKETYVLGDNEALDADEEVDVIIILGSKKVE